MTPPFAFRCTFTNAMCKPGYELIGGGAKRTCGFNSQWTGTSSTCIDIDECAKNTHTCNTSSSAVCLNNLGGFTCYCPVGTLQGGTCIGTSIPFTVQGTRSSLTIVALTGTVLPNVKDVLLSISQWGFDKTTTKPLLGYEVPKNLSRPINHIVTNLEPGLRFRVSMTFRATTGYLADVTIMGNSSGDVATSCGCSSTESTGSPTSVSAVQVLFGAQGVLCGRMRSVTYT